MRELIRNVDKHSHATAVCLCVYRLEDRIEIRVEDNGVGFDPAVAASPTRRGFGLFSIEEQLREIGGRFEIESSPGAGARALLVAPLESSP